MARVAKQPLEEVQEGQEEEIKDVTFIAKQMGIYQGRRVRPGERFNAPSNLKGKWFVREEKYQEPKLYKGSQAMTFSELMKQKPITQVEYLKETAHRPRPVLPVNEEPQMTEEQSVI